MIEVVFKLDKMNGEPNHLPQIHSKDELKKLDELFDFDFIYINAVPHHFFGTATFFASGYVPKGYDRKKWW